jgi:hypothetical protein
LAFPGVLEFPGLFGLAGVFGFAGVFGLPGVAGIPGLFGCDGLLGLGGAAWACTGLDDSANTIAVAAAAVIRCFRKAFIMTPPAKI